MYIYIYIYISMSEERVLFIAMSAGGRMILNNPSRRPFVCC